MLKLDMMLIIVMMGFMFSVMAWVWIRVRKTRPDELTFPQPTRERVFEHESQSGWGYADTYFDVQDHALVMRGSGRYELEKGSSRTFIRHFIKTFGIPDLFKNMSRSGRICRDVVCPKRSGFAVWTEDAFGDRFSQRDLDRIRHSHGQTRTEIQDLRNGIERCVDGVVWPLDEDEIAQIMDQAKQHNILIVPYGGGTNVTDCLKCRPDDRFILSLDMRRMNRVLWIDPINGLAEVQAGIVGQDLEDVLGRHGFCTGHDPDSSEFSTLGGWIATRASGMKRSRYGNIEDIVKSVRSRCPEGVLGHDDTMEPTAEKLATCQRTSSNFDISDIMMGSEGCLGVIISAVLRVHRVPEVKRYDSALFRSFEDGVGFCREIADSCMLPASVRLVDNEQFKFGQALKADKGLFGSLVSWVQKAYVLGIRGFDQNKMVACTILYEGSNAEVKAQQAKMARSVARWRGMRGGSESGRTGYDLTFAIAYIRDVAERVRIVADSFETSVPWSGVLDLVEAVKQTATERHAQMGLPGNVYITCRISQLYHTGACVYFYLAVYTGDHQDPASLYRDIEEACRETILRFGTVSHHHGIGKVRRDFPTFSSTEQDLLRSLQDRLDPNGMFRSGNGVWR